MVTASRSVISLKVRANRPTSSFDITGTRALRSPPATASLARASASTGSTSERTTRVTTKTTTATTAAVIPIESSWMSLACRRNAASG